MRKILNYGPFSTSSLSSPSFTETQLPMGVAVGFTCSESPSPSPNPLLSSSESILCLFPPPLRLHLRERRLVRDMPGSSTSSPACMGMNRPDAVAAQDLPALQNPPLPVTDRRHRPPRLK